jgi:hypothetical protein
MVTFGPGIAGLDGFHGAGLLTARHVEGREQARGAVSSGWPDLDALLPAGGVRRGSVIEFLAGEATAPPGLAGAGAATLACAVARRLADGGAGLSVPEEDATGGDGPRGGTIVVVDRSGWFHPPAMLPWLEEPCAGVGATGRGRLVVARPSRDDDEIWVIEQSLRCAGVAAVVAWPRPVPRRGLQQWTTALRRWQLAARSGGGVGLFVRPEAAVHEPSWAEARLVVTPLVGGTLLERRLRLVRAGGAWCGGGRAAEPAEIAIDLVRGRPPRALARRAVVSSPTVMPPQTFMTGAAGNVSPGGVSCRAS